MTPDEVQALFMQGGDYAFARWGRPIAPVVFGVEDTTLDVVREAIFAVAALAGQDVEEIDAELGANLMLFFLRDWDELTGVPDLDRLIPGLDAVVARLKAADAVQYRAFRHDRRGAIKAAFQFVRMARGMQDLPADTVALSQAVQTILTWGEDAFAQASPLARDPASGAAVLRPEIADLIRAAYDPVMPVAASDPAHALRLFARMTR